MMYRTLGKTGLDVSILSLGASSLGSVFRDTDDAESIRTVHTAVEMGVNLIDVSPYYGLTKAESVLGKAILQIARDKFILSTKAGRSGAGDFDFSEQRILTAWMKAYSVCKPIISTFCSCTILSSFLLLKSSSAGRFRPWTS
jgi:L-galactose dehydrogenase